MEKSKGRLYLPALKGQIGRWVYYATLMKFSEVNQYIKLTTEFYVNKKLSAMVQRAIVSDRTENIASYLRSEDERFFSSMVVAVYGGAPDWHPFQIKAAKSKDDSDLPDLDVSKVDAFGFLSLDGSETLFPLDGQHRLSGIKKALESSNDATDDLLDEELSVILVAHDSSKRGRMRSRRLFTTLNKRAVPVKKHETIALDEDDVMAIAARYLVEDHPRLSRKEMVAIRANANMPASDTKSLTTIGIVYDVLLQIFRVLSKKKDEELKYNRPNDSWLPVYNKCAATFFDEVGRQFKPFGECLKSKSHTGIVSHHRHESGGHILFRPVGLLMLGELVAKHIKTNWDRHFEDQNDNPSDVETAAITQIRKSIAAFKDIPIDLDDRPYRDLVWIPSTERMAPARRALVRDLLLNDKELLTGRQEKGLRARLVKALGRDVDVEDFFEDED